MKVQVVNDKRRVQSMSTSAQQNDDLISQPGSFMSPKKQILLTSSRYGEEVKAILKNIQETIGDEQSEQMSLRENSIKKESNYSIKSQNLFMQGPRSMIQRELALAVKAHRNSNSQDVSNNQVNKNSNTCSQMNLLGSSSRNQKKDTNFTKSQQIFMDTTPRQGFGSSFIIRKNLNNSIPSLSINTSGLKRDKVLQSFHFSNTSKEQQQQPNISKSPHFNSNSNMLSDRNANGNISPRLLLEGEFGCAACGASNSTNNGSGTRFRELQRLSVENSMLNKRIAELQKEVQDMDEFKIGLEHRHTEQNFDERRIDLLKAISARQQKQIRRLTSLLQTSKKLLTEILAVINFFKETSSKVHQAKQISNTKSHFKHQPTGYICSRNANSAENSNNNGETADIQEKFQEEEEEKNKLASTEDGILQQLDSKLANVSLRSLLNNIGLGEARDSFVNTFTSAYDKILQYERTNQEFKHMFAISQVNNNRNTYNRNNNNNNVSRSNVSIDLSPTVRSPMHKNNKNMTSSTKLAFNSENGQHYIDDTSSSIAISYKQPVTEFINKYKNYLPITTIFDSFPSQHKDTLHNMLSVLSAVVKKANQGFKQAATFQLFKSNPFLYIDQQNRLNLPETLLNYRGDFETYLRFKDKMLQIHLSQHEINQTEQLLSVLLDSLTSMYGDTLVAHKNDTSPEISGLITNLKKAIEQLIALGIIIGPDSGYNHARFLVVSTNASKEMKSNMKKLSSSLIGDDNNNNNRGNDTSKQPPIVSLKNLNLEESSQKTNKLHNQQQLSASRIGRMSNNVNNNPQSPISQSVLPFDVNEPDELRVLRVERDVECTNDFFDRHAICENVLDDLYRGIKNNSDQQGQLGLALKLAGIIQKLKLLFEMKNNMLLIKEAQIDFMRNQLYLYKQDINSCTRFVEQCQEGVSGFFDPIKTKFADLLAHFNSVMDSKTSSVVSDQKSKKNLVLHFKRTLKEILERVEQITNRPPPVNTLHILQIQQQFNEKVTILTQSQEHIKKLLAH